jgi:hypothetical protein
MRDLDDASWSRIGLASAAVGTLLDAKGFSSEDVRLLQEAHQKGIATRGWGRAQFATNAFSHYLAIWAGATTDREPPTLSIVRFDKTGTYALLVHGKIVANGKTLGAILPALAVAAAASTPDES